MNDSPSLEVFVFIHPCLCHLCLLLNSPFSESAFSFASVMYCLNSPVLGKKNVRPYPFQILPDPHKCIIFQDSGQQSAVTILYMGLDISIWFKYKGCAIRILHSVGFGGFGIVECSHHVFTWGLMSQFCLSTKNVPFGYCTVQDFGGFRKVPEG